MSRLCLTDRRVCPPEPYFRYVFPEDGYAAVGTTYDAWILEAGMHAQANGLQAPDPFAMEEQLCKTLPSGWCNYDDPSRPRVLASLGWEDVVGALNTFKEWLHSGRLRVDRSEADRRALICSRCYFNVHVSGCAGCQRLISEVVGQLRTSSDHALKSCAVCKCVLKAMVHLRVEDLRKTASQKDLYLQVGHCWLNPGSENYRG